MIKYSQTSKNLKNFNKQKTIFDDIRIFNKKTQQFIIRQSYKKFIFNKIGGRNKFAKNKVSIYMNPKINKNLFYLKYPFYNFGKNTPTHNKLRGLWFFKKNLQFCGGKFFFKDNFFLSNFHLLLELDFFSGPTNSPFSDVIFQSILRNFIEYKKLLALKKDIISSVSKKKSILKIAKKNQSKLKLKFKLLPVVEHFHNKFSKKPIEQIYFKAISERKRAFWIKIALTGRQRFLGFLFFRKLGRCLNTTGRLMAAYTLIKKSVFFLKKNTNVEFDMFDLFGYVCIKLKTFLHVRKFNVGRRTILIPKPNLGIHKRITIAVKLFLKALLKRSERSVREKLTEELKAFLYKKAPVSVKLRGEFARTSVSVRKNAKFLYNARSMRRRGNQNKNGVKRKKRIRNL